MGPYKWIPGIIIPIIFRLSSKSLLFPLVYVNLFDIYMKPYFIWKNKDKKIINIKK